MPQKSTFNGESNTAARPFLRWAGSKRRLLHKLAPYWSKSSNRYVEPFAGSAALFFALKPRSAVLSDTNGELIRTLITVCKKPGQVYSTLESLPRGRESFYN